MSTRDDISLDLGLQRSLWWRTLRRRAVVLAAALCFLEYKGLPHVRWTMTDSRGVHQHVTYWSVTGPASGLDTGFQGNDPLFLLLPLRRLPSSYAVDVFEHAKAALQSAAS